LGQIIKYFDLENFQLFTYGFIKSFQLKENEFFIIIEKLEINPTGLLIQIISNEKEICKYKIGNHNIFVFDRVVEIEQIDELAFINPYFFQ
jgi:hypothetical protein